LIVVPTLSRPRLDYGHGIYHPTWVEFSIFAGEVATLCLLYCIFVKLFPIISIWELREKHEEEKAPAKETVDVLSN
jgi:molybdopterin-containing oxidoreductase family membrane subunit